MRKVASRREQIFRVDRKRLSVRSNHEFGADQALEFVFADKASGDGLVLQCCPILMRAFGDLGSVVGAGGKLIAMCDVDPKRAEKAYQQYPDIPKFTDYRKMLDKFEKEIDGVVVSTPDHCHAVAALDAMRRAAAKQTGWEKGGA